MYIVVIEQLSPFSPTLLSRGVHGGPPGTRYGLTGMVCVPQVFLGGDLLMGEILIGEISGDGNHAIVGDARIRLMCGEETGRSFLR